MHDSPVPWYTTLHSPAPPLYSTHLLPQNMARAVAQINDPLASKGFLNPHAATEAKRDKRRLLGKRNRRDDEEERDTEARVNKVRSVPVGVGNPLRNIPTPPSLSPTLFIQ